MCENDMRRFGWFHHVAYFIATWGYSGVMLGKLLRRKPSKVDMMAGTVGSIVATVMLPEWDWNTTSLIIVNVVVTLVGVLIMPYAVVLTNAKLAINGVQSLGHDGTTRDFDHRRFVIDEVHGLWLAVLPVYMFDMMWWGSMMWPLLVALVLFRIFDISKWPFIKMMERWFDKQTNVFVKAVGVMVDDTVAGIYAAVVLYGLHWYYTMLLPVLTT